MQRIALVVFITASCLSVFMALAAAAAPPKTCGSVRGPTARMPGVGAVFHYNVAVVNTECSFAKSAVSKIVHRALPNRTRPGRAKGGPAGWVCIAEEVDNHVAVSGHCMQGLAKALSWVASP